MEGPTEAVWGPPPDPVGLVLPRAPLWPWPGWFLLVPTQSLSGQFSLLGTPGGLRSGASEGLPGGGPLADTRPLSPCVSAGWAGGGRLSPCLPLQGSGAHAVSAAPGLGAQRGWDDPRGLAARDGFEETGRLRMQGRPWGLSSRGKGPRSEQLTGK